MLGICLDSKIIHYEEESDVVGLLVPKYQCVPVGEVSMFGKVMGESVV